MLKLLAYYLKPYAALVVGACMLTFLQVLAELQLPHLMTGIVDVGIYQKDMATVLAYGAQMLAWALGSLVCVVCAALCASRAAMGFGRDVRSALFRAVQGFTLFRFNELGTSTLITRNTNDVQQIERFVQMLMTMAVMTPAMLIGALVMAFMTNLEMTLIVFVSMPILVVVVVLFFRVCLPLLRSLQQRIDNLNRIAREGLQGVRVIRAYNKESFEQKRFARANRDLAETYVKFGRLMGALMPVMLLVLNFTVVALYWFGAEAVDAGALSAGEIMALVQYLTLILMSLMMVSMVFAIAPRTIAACERVNEVLGAGASSSGKPEGQAKNRAHAESASEDAASCGKGAAPSRAEVAGAQDGEAARLRFENASFTFSGAQVPAVSDLNLAFEPGTFNVLIGPTGSGKTTVLNLALRLYDATEGAVFFANEDVQDWNVRSLRESISYVPQKSTLFTGTVRDNLTYGNPTATDEALMAALDVAQATEFVMSHEEGLDFEISQGGENLSGGQRQRLAIARALVRDAKLYAFDDSFSALDYRTDALVRKKLRAYLAGKTVLVVSQRVSTALNADQVVLLSEEGTVEDAGMHEELMQRCQPYRFLAESQLSSEGGE